MNQIRFSNLHNTTFAQSYFVGMGSDSSNSAEATRLHGVDEVVINHASGTLAQFQDAMSLSAVYNDKDRAYSFVI